MVRPVLADFTPDQHRAALLAGGETARAVARELGVSERSVHRWRDLPGFAALVSKHQSRMVAVAVGRFSRMSGEAAREIRKLLKHSDPNIRLRAADLALQQLVKVRTHADLDERLRLVESLSLEQPSEQPLEATASDPLEATDTPADDPGAEDGPNDADDAENAP